MRPLSTTRSGFQTASWAPSSAPHSSRVVELGARERGRTGCRTPRRARSPSASRSAPTTMMRAGKSGSAAALEQGPEIGARARDEDGDREHPVSLPARFSSGVAGDARSRRRGRRSALDLLSSAHGFASPAGVRGRRSGGRVFPAYRRSAPDRTASRRSAASRRAPIARATSAWVDRRREPIVGHAAFSPARVPLSLLRSRGLSVRSAHAGSLGSVASASPAARAAGSPRRRAPRTPPRARRVPAPGRPRTSLPGPSEPEAAHASSAANAPAKTPDPAGHGEARRDRLALGGRLGGSADGRRARRHAAAAELGPARRGTTTANGARRHHARADRPSRDRARGDGHEQHQQQPLRALLGDERRAPGCPAARRAACRRATPRCRRRSRTPGPRARRAPTPRGSADTRAGRGSRRSRRARRGAWTRRAR